MNLVPHKVYGALFKGRVTGRVTSLLRSRLPELGLGRIKSNRSAEVSISDGQGISSSISLSSNSSGATRPEYESVGVNEPEVAAASEFPGVMATSLPETTATTEPRRRPTSAIVLYENDRAPAKTFDDTVAALNMADTNLGMIRHIRSSPQLRDPRLERALLVDIAKYSLLTLPPDLSETEKTILWDAMPEQPQGHVHIRRQPRHQTKLRQIVNLLTRMLVAWISLLMPLLVYLGARANQLERKFELRERFSAFILLLALRVRKLDVEKTLRATAHSVALSRVSDAGYWLFDGLVGGVLDGLEDTDRGAVVSAEKQK